MLKHPNSQSAFFQLRAVAGLFVFLSGVCLALVSISSFSTVFAQTRAAKVSAPVQVAAEREPLSAADRQGRYVYLIEFAGGGMLQRQNREDRARFDANSREAKALQAQVAAEQAAYVQAMDSAIGRSVNPTHRYLATHSGIAARLTPAEANIVRGLSGVKSVERERVYEVDTYRGPEFIGAHTIWNGSSVPGGMGSRGAGMIVAVLDTGIVQAHPSFANDATCGHGQNGIPNKLLSALDCSSTDANGLCNGASPEDTNGHGSHTAGITAGNRVGPTSNPAPMPPAPHTEISGVAPCASIRAYKVCPTNSCPAAAIQAGMNSVLLHGDAHAMNFSISGGGNPWNDNDRRKLDIVDAGIIVAASAGNTSATITNPIGNVGHLGPWVMTVASSTHDGGTEGRLSASGPGTPPEQAVNIIANRGSASPVGSAVNDFPIRHFTGQPDTFEGCTPGTGTAPADMPPFPAGFFNGAAALIHRGGCGFTEKIQNAFDAGAQLVIIRNNQATPISMTTTGQPPIPAYSIEQGPGDVLKDFVDANPTTATIDFNPTAQIPGDILANSSLRGPSQLTSVTKPDITAPGVSILAPYVGQGGYAYVSGTSMSSPHAAGAATLIRSVRPAWTPMEVKSALMMTAHKTGVKNDRITPWDADDIGNGRVDLTKAARAGLVMHETALNFLNANPATGGDPKTLNIASMRNMQCSPHCVWKRKVRNTLTTPSTWTATATPGSAGYNLTVSPSTFDFNGNQLDEQEITITAVPTSDLSTGPVIFGEVVLSENGGQAPDAHMTVAIKGEPLVVGAVSRKTHGAQGEFDIPLPLLGAPGVESRQDPVVAGNHQIIVSFTSPVTFTGVSVVEGGGTATAVPSANMVTINLTGVPDATHVVVRLSGVSNGAGTTSATVDIPMDVLVGDVNANRAVNATDITMTKIATSSPATANGSNFRADVNASGDINATDVSIVKSRSGNRIQ